MKRKLKIGITCYPSIGGSGIVATELGAALARRGHEVHFISYEPPFRLDLTQPRVHFHEVALQEYKLFKYPDYTLPLAVKMREVSNAHDLDILHVHYAVPHATAALLSRQMDMKGASERPRVITTLHGTDITLVGSDPTLLPIVKYSIEQSCGVTAVSEDLKRTTRKEFSLRKEIEVIYNFYIPKEATIPRAQMRKQLGVRDKEVLAIHLSNMRPVKRIPDLLHIMASVERELPFKLLILAGGDFSPFTPLVEKFNIAQRIIVKENILDIENYIPAADFGIYTSEDESFGMGILETMSYGLPALATRVGGVAEVVEDEETGYLYSVGDVASFMKGIAQFTSDEETRKRMGDNARARAHSKFSAEKIVAQYEQYYLNILNQFGC